MLLIVSCVVSCVIRAEGSAAPQTALCADQRSGLSKMDSVRTEFKSKKKNINELLKNKNLETLLCYYQFYLEEKDRSRAKTLLDTLLKKDISILTRYNISLISSLYTSDSQTQTLFLADSGRLNEYRAYFLKRGISTLKSNIEKSTHYYNLAALDSASYDIAPDSLLRIKMAQHYNSLAWYSMLSKKLNKVGYYLEQSKKYDSQSKYPTSNSVLLKLLEKHFKSAKALYLQYKNQPFDKTYPTFKEVFLEDFKELEKEGINNSDIAAIKLLLTK